MGAAPSLGGLSTETDKQTIKQTNKQSNKQTNKQSNKQTKRTRWARCRGRPGRLPSAACCPWPAPRRVYRGRPAVGGVMFRPVNQSISQSANWSSGSRSIDLIDISVDPCADTHMRAVSRSAWYGAHQVRQRHLHDQGLPLLRLHRHAQHVAACLARGLERRQLALHALPRGQGRRERGLAGAC